MFRHLRKSRVLVEMLSDLSKYRSFLQNQDRIRIVRDDRFQFQSNFSARLQYGTEDINPQKITGFQISQTRQEGILLVKTSLCINEWIEDFKNVDFAEIILFDSLGNVNRILEFDLDYMGHKIGCDQFSDEILSPVFEYEIIS